jgi:hypothetical protein
MIDLKIEIEKTYRVWGEFFSQTTAEGWIDIFGEEKESKAIEIWQELSVSRIPNPLEVRAAIAGIRPHEDWQSIVNVSNGRLDTAQISITSSAALAKIGGLSNLRSADDRQIEKLRSSFWQFLDFNLGAESVEIALSEYLGGVAANPGLPAISPSRGTKEMTFLEAIEAVKGWEDRVYPTDIGRQAQRALGMASAIAAKKISRDTVLATIKTWSPDAKEWILLQVLT